MKLMDLTGQKIGLLTVIERAPSPPGVTSAHWLCECDCGNRLVIAGQTLRNNKMGDEQSCGCLKYLSDIQRGVNILWSRYRIKAEKRGIAFEVDRETFKKLVLSSCELCGQHPNRPVNFRGRELMLYNGIDRLDSDLPYTNENSISCCWICNRAKGSLSVEQYHRWLRLAYIHTFRKISDKTPGELIDSLTTETIKCFFEQEKLMNLPEGSKDALASAKRAQELNARRNKLMRSLDALLDFAEDMPSEKTYG